MLSLIGILLVLVSFIGLVIMRRNLIIVLMCLELLLLGIIFNFTVASVLQDDLYGQIFAVYILIIAGAESVIGLAILVVYYRLKGVLHIDKISSIKG